MKSLTVLALLAAAALGFTSRKPEPYRVVFDLTSRDSVDQAAQVRWIREVTSTSPDADLEIVMYGKGFELVMPDRSRFPADVKRAIANPKVKFKVCAMAMKNNNIDQSQLFPGVEIVPDGIYELVAKQQEHWGYIKASTSR